jgi:hypothetical protein
MKNLILAASLTLIAVPAFAAGTVQQTAAVTDPQQQKHSYSYSSDEGTGSAIAIRNANLHRAEQERSANSRAAYAGSVHFY